MSASGVQALAGAIGQLASGNINQLVGTNIGNLIAMASKGNLATYFKDGLTEATADILMNSIVSYLQELNNSSNNVVKSQLASVFGLSISDLMAASNVNVGNVSGNNLSYGGAQGYLGSLMGTAGTRMSTAEMLNNMYENFMFNMGSNIVGNPLLYSLYKTGDILDILFDDTSLGIEFIGKVETSLSDIFKLMSLGGSVIDFVGQLMSGAKLGVGSSLGDVFNSLGGLTKGSTYLSSGVGLNGTGSSESGTYGNMSTSNLLQTSLGGMRNELEQNRQAITGKTTDEDDINVVVPNIYKYLINTFDGKLDTLIKLSAVNSNYSVVDTVSDIVT